MKYPLIGISVVALAIIIFVSSLDSRWVLVPEWYQKTSRFKKRATAGALYEMSISFQQMHILPLKESVQIFEEESDRWGMPIQYSYENGEPVLRAAGKDRKLNTKDDLIQKVSITDDYTTKDPLQEISQQIDPATLTLEQGFNHYVQRMIVDDLKVETGIIKLKDGSSSKFWFRSHHLSGDMGGTFFKMSDGTEKYLAGWFCCEVQLPQDQLATLQELNQFIENHNGITP